MRVSDQISHPFGSYSSSVLVGGDMNDIDKLIFPNSVGDSSSTTTNDTLATCESTVVQTGEKNESSDGYVYSLC